MFVPFFGYQSYPIKTKNFETNKIKKNKKSGNLTFPLFLSDFCALFLRFNYLIILEFPWGEFKTLMTLRDLTLNNC